MITLVESGKGHAMKYAMMFASMVFCAQLYSQHVVTFQNQRNLIPEGIAIHPGNGTIYISSIAHKKIISLKADGTTANFIREGQDGFLEGLGMKVDKNRNLLWALSNLRKGNEFTSQIHAFEIASGKMVHHHIMKDTIPTLFNDLVIDKSGMLLITDTYQSSIYKYDATLKKLEVLVKDTSKFKWPNGIEFLDENNLAVATYGKGIVRINIQTKTISALSGYLDRSIAFGLDGLVVNGNHLYGVYNGGKEGHASNAVIKYTLDDEREHIISETIIDKGNPAFADPTTAAKHGGKLYVIANSHLAQFNTNKETVVGIENLLTPLKLVVYGL